MWLSQDEINLVVARHRMFSMCWSQDTGRNDRPRPPPIAREQGKMDERNSPKAKTP